jgi:superfamily I DNA/RNA helicase
VDEFQDINLGQYRLLQLLSPKDGNICAIGDPDQAIYGFRGSDVRFFSQFTETFDHVRCVRLNQNYRSTETILQASYQVIGNHHDNGSSDVQMRTYSQIQGDKTVSIISAASAKAEAVAIGRTIEQMVGGTGFHAIDFGKIQNTKTECSFSDFAILYRTLDQGQQIAQVLQEAGIPCQLAGRQNLCDANGVAKLLVLLRVLVDQGGYNDFHLLADLTMPGISRETLAGFKQWAYANQLPLAQALHEAKRIPISILSTTRQHRLNELIRFIEKLKSETKGYTVEKTLLHCVARTTLTDQVTDEQMQLLTALGKPYDQRLSDFVGELALQSDTDLYQANVEKVTLMTMHAAKGLEFEVVFIAGCEDGLIPYRRPGLDNSDMDEERRLFFVAMTRAKAKLYLCWARKRTLFGKTDAQHLSPFVDEVQHHLKSEVQSERPKSGHQQLSLF